MNNITKGITIDCFSIKDKTCLKFTLEGIFTREDAAIVSIEWKKIFASDINKRFVVIFNCNNMYDYNPGARSVIQNTITELKIQIEAIWVISNSKAIIAGASLMGLFTSFKIKVTDSERKILFE